MNTQFRSREAAFESRLSKPTVKSVREGHHRVQVILRESISAVREMNVEGQKTYLGEVRNFKNNEFLSRVLPKDLSISWTRLPGGRTLPAHFHPCASMVIVTKGSGESIGDTVAPVQSGDVIQIPEWNLHGFRGHEAEGFHALSIQFQSTAIFSSEERPETSYVDRNNVPIEDRQLKIVSRNQLPEISKIEIDGTTRNLGKVQNFSANSTLKKAFPEYFSAAWVELLSGERLEEHVHDTDSMIILTEGQGEVCGDRVGPIFEGDVIYVPAGCRHGFSGTGGQGFKALSIQFQNSSLYESKRHPQVRFIESKQVGMTFVEFLELNEKFAQRFQKNAIFSTEIKLLLKRRHRKNILLNCLQVMSNSFQRLMFSRIALCDSYSYRKVFFQHFMEELGHDLELKKERKNGNTIWDPILESSTLWFFGKNFLLDDPARIVMTQMVLEKGASIFYSHFAKQFAGDMASDHILKHSVADEGHDSMGVDLLRQETPLRLESLSILMQQSWDMLDLFLSRTSELIKKGECDGAL
ncbi:MAG: cupin domain-containing protein [Bdellovibrionales bacterium]|nr:cupin domain-containing protein [Bdellovibrionales bacterium]